MKLLCIVSGTFDATPGKAQIMNEMLLHAGFMNGVTSLFVPNLCSEQDNKVHKKKNNSPDFFLKATEHTQKIKFELYNHITEF